MNEHSQDGQVAQLGQVPQTDSVDPQWATLNCWLDGALSPAEERQVLASIEQSPAVAAEVRELRLLSARLASLRIEPPVRFADEVMARVRAERATKGSIWLAVAAAALLFVLAAGLVGSQSSVSAVLATLGTITGATIEAMLVGAGLVGASWHGAGVVLASWLSADISNLVFAFVGLVAANGILIALLRRRWRAVRQRQSR